MNATKAMTLLAAVAVGLSAQALTLAVKDVKIAQRYPWNGLVDIDYTVECDDPDADVYVYPVGYDKDYNLTEPIWTLTGEGANGQAVKAGTHRMTWNMAKDKGKNYNRAAYSIKMHAYAGAAPYLVVDLAAGPNAEKYPISYMSEMPGETWPEEYKTTKLVLKLIPAGTFMMGCKGNDSVYYGTVDGVNTYYSASENVHEVTLTQPFYMGVYELSEQQYCLIMGGSSSSSAAKTGLSYNALRGSTLGAQWPSHQQVDATSVLGRLRSRTGITFDLPTEAQWEYACKAGRSAEAKYIAPSPNGFGLYAMSVQPAEWCLDWFYNYSLYQTKDPKGEKSGTYRVVRGGFYTYYASSTSSGSIGGWASARGCFYSTSSNRSTVPSSTGSYNTTYGCRLVALPAAK